MAIVDYAYYNGTYMGTAIDQADFPRYEKRAEDIVCSMTHWRVSANTIAEFPEWIQDCVRNAICAQTEFFVVCGLESVSGGIDNGFTVGKVTVRGRDSGAGKVGGALAANLSQMVQMYLEQTGLMNPQVPTAPDMPLVGWW